MLLDAVRDVRMPAQIIAGIPDVNDGLSDCLDVIALHGNGAMSYIDVMAHTIFENDRTGDNLHRSLRIDSLHSLGTSRNVAGC